MLYCDFAFRILRTIWLVTAAQFALGSVAADRRNVFGRYMLCALATLSASIPSAAMQRLLHCLSCRAQGVRHVSMHVSMRALWCVWLGACGSGTPTMVGGVEAHEVSSSPHTSPSLTYAGVNCEHTTLTHSQYAYRPRIACKALQLPRTGTSMVQGVASRPPE